MPSGTAPPGVTPADIFALHIYTRSELFGDIKWALRVFKTDYGEAGPNEWQQTELVKATPVYERWRPVVWHMSQAVKRSSLVPGLYYRGVTGLLHKFGDPMQHKPHDKLKLEPFTSSTVDPRVAGQMSELNWDSQSFRACIIAPEYPIVRVL